MERNEFIERDGLYWQSDTHEWFNDTNSTNFAQKEDIKGISLPNIMAFIIRNKETGEYDRVLFDTKANQIIFDSKSLEEVGTAIDRMKLVKHFKR